MPLLLDAAQVTISFSLDSRTPLFGAAASATMTLSIVGTTGPTGSNEPE